MAYGRRNAIFTLNVTVEQKTAAKCEHGILINKVMEMKSN